jgi:hypothetical protein
LSADITLLSLFSWWSFSLVYCNTCKPSNGHSTTSCRIYALWNLAIVLVTAFMQMYNLSRSIWSISITDQLVYTFAAQVACSTQYRIDLLD